MTAATPDRAALHSALQDTLAMARTAQAELAALAEQALRDRAAPPPLGSGRALLWRLKARADELRAQIAITRSGGAA
jgi:hypothetical protein